MSEQYRASAILEGYEKIGCEAINVGRYELLCGLSFLKERAGSTSIPFISANLRDKKGKDLLFDPYRIVQRGHFNVGIIGLTSMLPDTMTTVTADDYLETGRSFLKKLKAQVDILVMLVNTDRKNYESLPAEFPEADFIFVSGSTMLTRPNMPQEKGGPYIYSSGKQGKQLTIVELKMENESDPIVDVSYYHNTINYIQRRLDRLQKKDPDKPLEEIYAEQENVLKLIKAYRQEQKIIEIALENAVNILQFQNIPMGDSIKDDPNMLSFVDRSLATCSSLKVIQADNRSGSSEKEKASNGL